MESQLETVALFALKLAYETDGGSLLLRDDVVMGEHQKEVFELLLRKGDIETIRGKVKACVAVAMEKPLGRELQRLADGCDQAQTTEELKAPLILLKDYLKDIQ